jgi:hypothetical protein
MDWSSDEDGEGCAFESAEQSAAERTWCTLQSVDRKARSLFVLVTDCRQRDEHDL